MDARFGYESYKLYLGIKLHYNSDYDFNKYHGKVSASFSSFLKRNDKFQFAKLRKQYNGQLKDFYIANFQHKDYWVGDLFGEEAKQNYTEWKKYNQSLLYSFEKDIRYLNSLEEFWTIYLFLTVLVILGLLNVFYPSPYHLEQEYYLTPYWNGVPA